jgi:hypothetical protein
MIMNRDQTLKKLKAASTALEQAKTLADQRNTLIVQARDERLGWEEICEATGLSRQAAYTAFQRARKAK